MLHIILSKKIHVALTDILGAKSPIDRALRLIDQFTVANMYPLTLYTHQLQGGHIVVPKAD